MKVFIYIRHVQSHKKIETELKSLLWFFSMGLKIYNVIASVNREA